MTVLINGIAVGVLLFLVASGLTLMVGVLDVANLAHAGFFGIGAYAMYWVLRGHNQPSVALFALAVACAGALSLGVGVLAERALYARMARFDALRSLLGTYGLLLIIEGAIVMISGNDQHAVSLPPSLNHPVSVLGAPVPGYSLVLIALGVVVAAALELALHRTDLGRQVVAVSEDRTMASLLGINVRAVYAIAVATGAVLGGVGGALASPTLGIFPDVGEGYLISAFAVIVVGGMGSISGALVGALVIGLIEEAIGAYAPSLATFMVYVVMGVVLVLRPRGLLPADGGREE